MTNGDRIRQMPEVRLIDANALMKKICWNECGCYPEDCGGMEWEG